jgi:uncharacterized membrane protein YgcG
LLSYDSANLVEGLIQQVERGEEPYVRAPCGDQGDQGFQVAVALMRRFQVEESEDAGAAAARFARELHAAWGVGSAACNNGVLLLLSADDRQVFISTGSGSEARLPRATLLNIMANMKPALKERRYDTAVLEAVHEIGLALAGADVPASASDRDGIWIFSFFATVVAGVFIRSWLSNRRQMRRYKVG